MRGFVGLTLARAMLVAAVAAVAAPPAAPQDAQGQPGPPAHSNAPEQSPGPPAHAGGPNEHAAPAAAQESGRDGTRPAAANRPAETPPADPAATGAPPAAAAPQEAAPAPRRRVRIRSVGGVAPERESPPEGDRPTGEIVLVADRRAPVRGVRGAEWDSSSAAAGPAASGGSGPAPAAVTPPVESTEAPRPEPAPQVRAAPEPPPQPLTTRILPRPVREIVEVVPGQVWAALGALALLALVLGASSWMTAVRARRLSRQRAALLQEVGLLQSALLPAVPPGIPASVAYRPAAGTAPGRDFYDAFALAGGRTGIVLGDMAGRGRDALSRTTFVRYTLRAYLEAGLEPREVLRLGAQALADHLQPAFASVIVAVHEPASGRLTYASAGHAPPIVVGDEPFEPVMACSAPPLGLGERTGFRQTMLTLTAGSVACLYTDGVVEARVDGRLLGVGRLERTLADLPPTAGADELLDWIGAAADETGDDMAVCVLRAGDGAPATGPRIEEIEVDEREVGDSLEHFLRSCGVPLAEVPGALREAGQAARRDGSATVRVRLNDFRPGVDVVPGNVVRLDERRRSVRGL